MNKKAVLLIGMLSATIVSGAVVFYQSDSQNSNISVDVKPTVDSTIISEIAPTFTGETVTVQDLLKSLEEYAVQTLEPSVLIQKEFAQLVQTHNITDNKKNYNDYVRVRLAFEATRDGGLWGMRWAVTNQEPTSTKIWQQWQSVTKTEQNKASATAECDELSALFSVVARGLGVKDVGLFWPTWNHTVAVWTVDATNSDKKRIVLPTSQVFLTNKASLGTKEFDPYKQKIIYNYEAKDIQLTDTLPTAVANMMMSQVQQYAHLSQNELQKRRNEVSNVLGGS